MRSAAIRLILLVDGGAQNGPTLSTLAIMGRCPEMQKVYKSIGRISARNISMLVRGESETK